MNKSKKAFTIVELVIVIAVIAVLAAVLIPTFSNITKKAKESAYLQERTNQQIADMTEKLANLEYMTWEDFEAELAKQIADINKDQVSDNDLKSAIEKAIEELEKSDYGLSEDQIRAIIEKSLEGQLTTAQVKAIIDKVIADLGKDRTLTDAQIQQIIADALASFDKDTGISKDEVGSVIEDAVKDAQVPGLSEQDIQNIINSALAGFGNGGLTEQEIQDIINSILGNMGNGDQDDEQ